MAKNSKPADQGNAGEGKDTGDLETQPGNTKDAFSKKANELLKAFGKDVIFRCPKTGQWFTNEGYADTYSKQKNIQLEVYKK